MLKKVTFIWLSIGEVIGLLSRTRRYKIMYLWTVRFAFSISRDLDLKKHARPLTKGWKQFTFGIILNECSVREYYVHAYTYYLLVCLSFFMRRGISVKKREKWNFSIFWVLMGILMSLNHTMQDFTHKLSIWAIRGKSIEIWLLL